MLGFDFFFCVRATWIGLIFSHAPCFQQYKVHFGFDFMVSQFGSWVNFHQPHYGLCDAYFRCYATHIHSLHLDMENPKKMCSNALMELFLSPSFCLNLHEEKASRKRWERFSLISFWRRMLLFFSCYTSSIYWCEIKHKIQVKHTHTQLRHWEIIFLFHFKWSLLVFGFFLHHSPQLWHCCASVYLYGLLTVMIENENDSNELEKNSSIHWNHYDLIET